MDDTISNINFDFLTAKEVAAICRVKDGKAYKIIRELNGELKELGYYTIAGKINKKYFLEKFKLIEKDLLVRNNF